MVIGVVLGYVYIYIYVRETFLYYVLQLACIGY